MKRIASLRDRALRTGRRAGWAGALGGLLLVAAIGVAFGGNAWFEKRYDELAAERLRLASLASSEPARDAQRPGDGVGDFHARFPTLSELPRTLTRLHFLADKHALEHERTDYRSSDEPGTPLVRVSLTLPVRGDFGQMYAWLGEALADLPALALESIAIRRDDSEIGLVQAEIRFVVFVRRPS